MVHVGGGATWETVDVATIACGFGTTGGTVNHTGVGGLLLGGGYGWLSGEHGLVIDNLVQATVVIANGSVVTASPTSHPDLFWGLRGGGSNFGVVTEFVLKIHPQRKTVSQRGWMGCSMLGGTQRSCPRSLRAQSKADRKRTKMKGMGIMVRDPA